MPELPEVEVVKRSLKSTINNLIIKGIKINDGNLRYKVKKHKIGQIIGSKITDIKRRSKYLIFYFNTEIVMIVHLGMTGKFFVVENNGVKRKASFYYDISKKDEKHNKLIFLLNKKVKLIYNDVRKFGFIKLEKVKNININSHLKILGPEALSNSFDFNYFKKKIIGKNRTIKDFLMDQKNVAGLGNIYVNELLHFSKIKPSKKVKLLDHTDIRRIIRNTKYVLKKAIKYGGSSIKNFSNSTGNKGNFQHQFSVYDRKDQNCSNSDCKGVIKKIVISNRASFFCSKCQK